MRAATSQLARAPPGNDLTMSIAAARSRPARQGVPARSRGQHPHRHPGRLRRDDHSTTTASPTRSSVQQLLVGASVMMMLAVGETLVIITRNVDLSIGSVLGLSAYVVGDLFAHNPTLPRLVGLCAGTGRGPGLRRVNGAIVTVARVPSLVVTLGTLYAIRGIDAIVVNGLQINPSSIPSSFIGIGYETIIGIPWIFIIATVLVLIVGYVMRTFRPARDLYAIGSDPDGGRCSPAFLLAGGSSSPSCSRARIAGFAGGLWLAEFATVSSVAGLGYELLVVAARRRRRRGHLRRQRHGSRRRARCHPPQHDQPGTCGGAHLRLLGRGAGRRPPDHRHRVRPLRLPAS